MYREEIENIMMDADIPVNSKYQTIALFELLFEDYWMNGNDAQFESIQLRDLWWFVKIQILSKIVNLQNEKAYKLLSRELNLNAKKYINPKFDIKRMGAK